MYRQINDANWRIPYVGGWCEGFVEGAWGQASLPTVSNQSTSGKYASAMAAWNAEPNKHYDLPPVGKTVPVYFSLGSTSYGHVAISLDDGKVASSTQGGFHSQGYIHPNLNDLISMYAKYNNGCTYLGWGEHVGNIRVIEPAEPNATAEQVQQDYKDILERPADPDGLAHYAFHYTNDFVRADLYNSDEYKRLQASKIVPEPVVEAPESMVTPEPEPVVMPEPEPVTKPIDPPTNIVVTSPSQVDNPTWRYKTWWEQIISVIINFINKLKGIK